jgi:hypothetical protein
VIIVYDGGEIDATYVILGRVRARKVDNGLTF